MKSIENMNILCVEDDAFAREEMTRYLKKRVRAVFPAADGAEGLELFEDHKPDIIIADLLMPGIDGLEMIRRLREKGSHVHVVIVTSVNSVDTVLEAVELGVDSYLIKPIDFTELEMKLCKIGDTIQAERGHPQGPLDILADRRTREDGIKKGFIKILREFTGKGPRETIVQLIGSNVKITVFGASTQLEQNLLQQRSNHETVRHMRMLVYEAIAGDVAKQISGEIGRPVAMEKVDINLKKSMDQLVFRLQTEG